MNSEWNNIEFIQLLNSIANRFISIDIQDIDQAVNEALQIVVKSTDVQRGYIFLFSNERTQLKLAYEDCSPQIEPHKGILESINVVDFKDFVDQLEKNNDIQVGISELSDTPENKPILEILKRLSIKSFINIPMFYETELVGYIGFDSVSEERDWSDQVRYTFRFTGNTIAGALYRKRQHDLLQKVLAQQRAMLDNLPYNAWLKNAKGKYLAVNKHFLTTLDKSKQEVIHRYADDVFPEEIAAISKKTDAYVIENNKQYIADELVSTEQEVWHKTYKTPVIDHYGNIIGLAGMSIDITELKKTEENLKKLNEAKNLLFSTIAHDIRSPIVSLNALMNIVLQYEESLNPEEKKQYSLELNRQIEDTLFLLENLFQWAQLQQKGILLNREKTSLYVILQEAMQNVAGRIQDKNITLEAPEPFNLIIYADKHMITTVLRNILSNAIKFTPEQGKITITVRQEAGRISLNITDTGVGIPPENIAKLFSEETRLTTKGTNEERGSGLGLMLSKTYIEQNEGTISIKSNPGEGTTVTLSLPL